MQTSFGTIDVSTSSEETRRVLPERLDHPDCHSGDLAAQPLAVQAGIVFGFDNDTPVIFKDTLDFLEETGVQNATFNILTILTPYPGTPLFQRLHTQRRMLTRDWRKYNGRSDVVFQPKQMSADELLAGFRYANRRFYSLPSVAKRMWRSPVQVWWTLPLNLMYAVSWANAQMGRSPVVGPA